VVVPTFVAAVSWPVFCLWIHPGGYIFMPVVWAVTCIWATRINRHLGAWTHARRVAAAQAGRCDTPPPYFGQNVAIFLNFIQLIAITATCPAYFVVLNLLGVNTVY